MHSPRQADPAAEIKKTLICKRGPSDAVKNRLDQAEARNFGRVCGSLRSVEIEGWIDRSERTKVLLDKQV